MSSKRKHMHSEMNYIDTLNSEAKARYIEKMDLIGGVNPYELTKTDLSDDIKELPNITYPDIVNYLVNMQSAYTLTELKAYKSLTSYNYFVCGLVRHSRKIKAPPLQPWIVSEIGGVILAGHCNCLVGLGEVCNHIGALLFSIEAAVKLRNAVTVTDEPAYWKLPTRVQKVDQSTVKNINFTSATSLKKKLDEDLITEDKDSTNTHISKRWGIKGKLPDVPEPTDEEMSVFFRRLYETGVKSAILSIIPPYCDDYVPCYMDTYIQQILSEPRDEKYVCMSKEQLFRHCEAIFIVISKSMTPAQATKIEAKSRSQEKSRLRYALRTGMIVDSQMKDVFFTNIENPSYDLIMAICYRDKRNFRSDCTSQYTKWERDHKQKALKSYTFEMKTRHENFQVRPSGLLINPDWPFIIACPDFISSCNCCGEGIVEIKCPFPAHRSKSLSSEMELNETARQHSILPIKVDHRFYYQLQTQVCVSAKEHVDIVVWTRDRMSIERFIRDKTLWPGIVEKASVFYINAILPEVFGKFYTRQKKE